MKVITKIFALSLILSFACSYKDIGSESKPKKKSKVIFFGDSITRRGTVGDGYINQLDSICKSENKSDEYQFIGSGIGGNTIGDLLNRVDSSVIQDSPDVVVIFVGVNDMGHPPNLSVTERLNQFEDNYNKLIAVIRSKLPEVSIIMCNIASLNEASVNWNDTAYNGVNIFNKKIKEIASSQHVPLCDIRQAFVSYYIKNKSPGRMKSGTLTIDGVHPSIIGNRLIANTLWKYLKSVNTRT
jgi:lysophospholipase L1-like esterase